MKTYYSDPTANAVIAKITREEKKLEKRLRRAESAAKKNGWIWRPGTGEQKKPR